ncbi:A24 family peptidase [Anaerococcus sp. AGMB09787]|uniref:prepilin peptidase n=1 Tax=Anaerococcus sp. AGMB09787 TaxID=2922869 RepID=UPI001FB03773|nr:A24 family peptidase [Anaerococcus sp. AGMB09787]
MLKIYIFAIGAIFGSFAGLVVERSISGESIVLPGSHCDSCGKSLKFYENIPILSFIIQGGKCRRCGTKIPPRYFIMEILGGILILLATSCGLSLRAFMVFLSLLFALIVALIDLRTMDIYMSYVYVLIGFGIVYRLVFTDFSVRYFKNIGIFTLLYLLVYFISKKSIGDGDLFFYLALSLFVRDSLFVYFCLISIWLGGIWGMFLLIKYRDRKMAMPFGIFIFLSFLITSLLEVRFFL